MEPKPGQLRDGVFLGATQSLCPECLGLVQAKIVASGSRIYFDKFCSRHGSRSDFVCSSRRWFDRNEFAVPGRLPVSFGVEPTLGCPYDCGLCTAHEQHTCIAVLEVTSSCNLSCPMCYASSGPGGQHLSFEDCCTAIDRLVFVEGQPEILQLSGGEPTIHPQFAEIFEYACSQPIDLVMINTNGIRLANDHRLCELLARHHSRCQVYLQMDGLSEQVHGVLRGVSLLDTKLRAIEMLGEYGINTTLVTTLQTDLNMGEIGGLVRFAIERPWITGVSFQPATYVGRTILPEDLERRITFPDVIEAVEEQTDGLFRNNDFFPVPCAHPNAHTLSYAFRQGNSVIPITRFVNIDKHFDLLANGISLNRQNTREIVSKFLARRACGTGGGEGCGQAMEQRRGQSTNDEVLPTETAEFAELAGGFFARAIAEDLAAADMFRITTTSFMDAYNFDVRQIMKSCVHHLLPSGHLIPFCAYNLLYRDGRVALPVLNGVPRSSARNSSSNRLPIFVP